MIHGRGFIRGMGCGGWVFCRNCGGVCSQDDVPESPDLSVPGAGALLERQGHREVGGWVRWAWCDARWPQVTQRPPRPSGEQMAAALERLQLYARTERAVAWIRATYDKEG